jgi:hypothetical protein
MSFWGVMDQVMSILVAEEGSSEMDHSCSGSSSLPQSKHRRCYINCDHEVAHLML